MPSVAKTALRTYRDRAQPALYEAAVTLAPRSSTAYDRRAWCSAEV